MKFEDLPSWIAMVLAIVATYMAWKKAPAEKRATDADGALKNAQASGLWAEQNAKLMTRVDTLECEVEQLKDKLGERDRLIEEWQAGFDRVLMQVGSLGIKPVWTPSKPEWLKK